MKKDFAKKLESWNKKNKAKREAKVEQETTTKPDGDALKSKKSFSRQVYEWNQHYRKGKRLQEEEEQQNDESKAEDKEQHESTQVDINQKVMEWNQHYKSVSHQLANESPGDKRVTNLQTIDENSVDLSEKVNKWELFYHPTRRENREEERPQTNSFARSTAAGDERMTELVHKWNRHYSMPRRRITSEEPTSSSNRRSSLNRVTSLLVKHWDDHYIAITKDSQLTPAGRRASLRPDSETSASDQTQQPVVMRKNLTRKAPVRTPSIVKARIEEFATQSTAVVQRRQQRPKSYQPEMLLNSSLCRTRSNIAELKSKFTPSRYDPKSAQRICN